MYKLQYKKEITFNLVIAFSQVNLCQTSSMQERQYKQIRFVASNIIFISALVQPDNYVVQTFDTQLSNEVISSPPFLSVSPFMLLNLAR